MFGILVGAVLERRALHVVAVVQEDESVTKFSFHLLDDMDVVGKFVITAVSISGFDECQGGLFWSA